METLHRDYSPRGVKFYYVYKSLAHPETNGYVVPITLKERLMHVKEAERTLGSKFSWLCDSMDNAAKHALGSAPNSEFIVDPDGKIVRRRAWSDPKALRSDLEELVGPVEHPTQIADLGLKRQPPPKAAAKGIVPRVVVPRGMRPLITEAVAAGGKTPYYAKLRAEVDERFQRTGQGKLYLGFYMDPIYHVHWNNLAKPIEYELELPDGVEISPQSGTGPKIDVEGDIDPREFLLDIKTGQDIREPLKLTVRYFACNDEQGWCIPVTQEYLVQLQLDPDGGWDFKRLRGTAGNRQQSPRRNQR